MDLTASPILMREVAEAIDFVCHGISPRDSISIDAVGLSCFIFDVFTFQALSRNSVCVQGLQPVPPVMNLLTRLFWYPFWQVAQVPHAAWRTSSHIAL